MEHNRHFTLIVIGNNPDDLIKPYDNNIEVEPYVMYEFKRAGEYHEAYKRYYQIMFDTLPEGDKHRESVKEVLEHLNEIDDTEFYLELTDGKELDEETGDLIITDNPDGKYDTIQLGKLETAWPLITKSGDEVFTALKGDVDWPKVHMEKKRVKECKRLWEMVMEDSKPKNKREEVPYENMKDKKNYFNFFGTKENYVSSSCAFWGYAVIDQNGWTELEDNVPQVEWISNFYDRFIKGLPDNARITIYDCFRF